MWLMGSFWRPVRVAAILIGLMTLGPTSVEAKLSLTEVLKQCDEKLLITAKDADGKIVVVGEQIDEYCRGVLDGILSAQERSGAACVKSGEESPYFLLSVVKKYLEDKTSTAEAASDDAATIIGAAFQRAFGCASKNAN